MSDAQKVTAGNEQEYSHTIAMIQHYSTHRFTSVTVYLGVTGVLLGVAFGLLGQGHSSMTSTAVKVAGVFVTLLFGCFEAVTTLHLKLFVTRAVQLEGQFGYELWSKRPKTLVVAVRVTMLAFYLAMLLFWLGILVAE